MKKLVSIVMLIVFTASLWLGGGYVATVFAAGQAGAQDLVAWQPYDYSPKAGALWQTSPYSFAIYLPTVIGPPPLNPKKGVGVVASPACADLAALKASWYLNWDLNPDPTCGSGNEKKFVPRIVNASSMSGLDQAIANAQASGWLIGFSEPNLPWQGNLSPTQGAVLWKQIEDKAILAGVKLVSPSPNQWEPGQGGQTYGHQWTWVMVDEYKKLYGTNPRFDAIAWNIYKREPGDTQAFLTARHNEALTRGYNVPIWVLEYGGECWNSANGKTGNSAIMNTTTAWFEATPWIDRYAWFANRLSGSETNAIGWQSCSLVNPDTGQLTTLGQTYSTY